MIYICIDTNVYIHLLTELVDNCNNEQNDAPNQLHELNLLCKKGVVKVLIPEVVKLELQKTNNKVEEDYKREYSKLIDTIDKTLPELWNEIRDTGKKIIDLTEEEQNKKIDYWSNEYKKLITFFKKDYIQTIELTPDIICECYKKKIEGLITDSQMNDALIIESVYSYLKKQEWKDYDLLFFVTGDKKDFFTKGQIAGFNILKKKFEISLERIYGLYSLKQLYKYIDANYHVNLEAIDIETRWEEFKRKYPEWDFENDEAIEEHNKIEDDINTAINILFNNKLQDLPEDIRNIRKRVLSEIEIILKECRSKISWDDRSELKLYQWLNNRHEIDLYSSKLSDLFQIRDSLQKYLKVHEEMDRDMLEGYDWKICCKCRKVFVYEFNEMNVLGSENKVEIVCPYCKTKNGLIMNEGTIKTYRTEDVLEID
jgi:vacuolar-type H+-ATPase subunit H